MHYIFTCNVLQCMQFIASTESAPQPVWIIWCIVSLKIKGVSPTCTNPIWWVYVRNSTKFLLQPVSILSYAFSYRKIWHTFELSMWNSNTYIRVNVLFWMLLNGLTYLHMSIDIHNQYARYPTHFISGDSVVNIGNVSNFNRLFKQVYIYISQQKIFLAANRAVYWWSSLCSTKCIKYV